MGFLDKIASYVLVTYYRQTRLRRLGMLFSYFMAVAIVVGVIIATVNLLLS